MQTKRANRWREGETPAFSEKDSVSGFGEPDDQRTRILLVESETSVRESLYALLENDGRQVLAASDGRNGLTVFHRSVYPIPLLITEFDMPGMTGLELAQACARRNRDVAVLYLSVSHPNEELEADLAMNRRAFLAKPFGRSELLRKTRELLAPGFVPAAIVVIPKFQLSVRPVSRPGKRGPDEREERIRDAH